MIYPITNYLFNRSIYYQFSQNHVIHARTNINKKVKSQFQTCRDILICISQTLKLSNPNLWSHPSQTKMEVNFPYLNCTRSSLQQPQSLRYSGTRICTKGPLINDQTNTLGNWAHKGTVWWLRGHMQAH